MVRVLSRPMKIAFLLLAVLLAAPAAAQQRPLTTQPVDVVRPGEMLVQFGVEFLQGATFPLSGLSGDLSRVGVVDLHIGLSRAVELQIQGTIRNFLSVNQQVPAQLTPTLKRGGTSASDFGDFTLAVKFQLYPETKSRPALGIRFGFEAPNSDEARGIGLNTTNVFFTLLAQKHYGKLNLFGNLGVGILQAPIGLFEQNDVVLYGLGAIYPVHQRVNLVAEVAGRWSTRDTPATGPLVGTGSRSQARLGVQVFSGGFRWDFAGVAGLTRNDPNTGFVLGVAKSFDSHPNRKTPR